jgi:hypothetical protein
MSVFSRFFVRLNNRTIATAATTTTKVTTVMTSMGKFVVGVEPKTFVSIMLYAYSEVVG